MSNVTIQKRGNFYQYKFEIAKVDGSVQAMQEFAKWYEKQ